MSIENPGQLNVDVVGIGGHYNDSHGPFIARSELFNVTGVAEIDEMARTVLDLPEAATAASYTDLLEKSTAQATIITTGDVDHYTSAYQALHAGKSVLVEKPAAATAEECAQLPELFDYAQEHGLRYWVCHPRECDTDGPWYTMAQLIGDPQLVEETFGVSSVGKLQELRYDCFYTLPAQDKPDLHKSFADDKMNHNVVSALQSLPDIAGFSNAVLLDVRDERTMYDARMLTIPTGEHDEPVTVKMSGRRSAHRENHPQGVYRDWVEAIYEEGILRVEPSYGTITFTYGKGPKPPIEFDTEKLYDGMFTAINDGFARCVLDPKQPEPFTRETKLLGTAAAILMQQPGSDGMITEEAINRLR
jgi:predicted dehydrogenase